jgi:nucleoside-diphosphate-sugar epimerase
VEANVLFGTQVLEAMARHHIPYLVNTGTSWQHFLNQSYSPVNLYAATKQAFEDILRFFVQSGSLTAITLKLFDTYGAGDPRRKLFALLREAARSQQPLAMSAGEQFINLVHVDDVARAFLVAANRLFSGLVAGHEVYAVSSGNPIPLRELVELCERVGGVPIPVAWGKRPYRQREVMEPWSTGETLPGWFARIGLAEGLRSILEEPT